MLDALELTVLPLVVTPDELLNIELNEVLATKLVKLDRNDDIAGDNVVPVDCCTALVEVVGLVLVMLAVLVSDAAQSIDVISF